MNDNQILIRLTIKDAFNGQSYVINVTEPVWDNLVQQVEVSRHERRKKLKLIPTQN